MDLIAPYLEQMYYMFIDANVLQSVIWQLSSVRPSEGLVVANRVSRAEARRLRSALSGLDVLFCNRREGAIPAGFPLESQMDAVHIGTVLSTSAPLVIITAGREGAFAVSARGIESVRLKALSPIDVTGAGDALFAAFVYGLQRSGSIQFALDCGIASAVLAVLVEDSAPLGLSPGFLERAVAQGRYNA